MPKENDKSASMRKKLLKSEHIALWKGTAAIIAAELDKEKADQARWEQHRIDFARVRAQSFTRISSHAWFHHVTTRRHQGDVRILERCMERLRKTFLRCGATTRRGTPCQCKPEAGKSRCKLHGGKSTGPKTEAGREAIRESNRRRAETKRAMTQNTP